MRNLSDTLPVILNDVEAEYLRATELHAPMQTTANATYILEKQHSDLLDKLIFPYSDGKPPNKVAARKELTQIAAMAVRAIHDLCAGD